MKRILLIGLIIIIVSLLVWSPWLNNENIYNRTFQERAHIDGTIDKYRGDLICDYRVWWVPFGRAIGSCEALYFVSFWGERF